MSDDRSLTEFSATEAAVSDDTDDSKQADSDPDTEPATITYRWQPDSADCAACGNSTRKQWLDSGAFVCPDCKSWA